MEERINGLFKRKATTQTKGNWCLRQGMQHVANVNDGQLCPLVLKYGIPGFYETDRYNDHRATQDMKDPSTCFQSLVRTVAGQFVSGKSAQATWNRILQVVAADSLTPQAVLGLAAKDEPDSDLPFQKRAGLTRAKAASIVDLAQRFQDGRLSESMLTAGTEDEVRKALLEVKGIGPWSCDIFLMFYLEHPNILPLGDLGIRKGLAKYFGWTGSGKGKELCGKQDAAWIREKLSAYDPYLTLLSYYMWRVNDIDVISPNGVSVESAPLVNDAKSHASPRKKRVLEDEASGTPESHPVLPSSATKPTLSRRRSPRRVVTP
jgi:DNA-3-methyladenine glycosylase II